MNCSFTSIKSASPISTINVATWNVAAINNNPFEYWITHSDKEYNALMDAVQVAPLMCHTSVHARLAAIPVN